MRRRFPWPRSLFGRNLLLLLALIFLTQASTVAVYLLMQRPRVIETASLLATQANTLNAALSQVTRIDRDAYVARLTHNAALHVQSAQPLLDDSEPTAPLVRLFVRIVRARLTPGIELRWSSQPQSCIWVHVSISGERYWLMLPVHAALHYRWLTSMIVLSLCMAFSAALGAWLIQRRINQPLRDIAQAARNFGFGGRPERLPAYPVTELAVVAEQFNAMMDNLAQMEASRTLMLAGISHDIRSPLTKLRLALALDAHTAELPMIQYIEQIDAIVGQFLDFGRAGSDEALSEGDLNTLIMQLNELFAERGHAFTLNLQPMLPWRFRPIAMLRLVNNLMENAVKYGVSGLEMATWIEAGHRVLAVRDRGPGLAEGDELRLLQPFARADRGRSQVSGSGLGLAIVDRIARLDGGRLQLLRREGGGLEAQVRWPVQG